MQSGNTALTSAADKAPCRAISQKRQLSLVAGQGQAGQGGGKLNTVIVNMLCEYCEYHMEITHRARVTDKLHEICHLSCTMIMMMMMMIAFIKDACHSSHFVICV